MFNCCYLQLQTLTSVRIKSSNVTLTLCVPTLKDPMSAVVVEDLQETRKYVQVGKLLSDHFG